MHDGGARRSVRSVDQWVELLGSSGFSNSRRQLPKDLRVYRYTLGCIIRLIDADLRRGEEHCPGYY